MRGNRDICCRYYTRFSHRARDDVLPSAVDSTQAAASLPDLTVGRMSGSSEFARNMKRLCTVRL